MVLRESKEICLKSSKKGTSNVEFTRGFQHFPMWPMPWFAWFCPAKERAISVLLFFCEATQPRAPSADGVLKSSFVSSAVRSRQPRDVGWQVLCVVAYSPTLNQRWACLSAGTGKSERLQIDVEHHHTTCYNSIKSSISLTDLRENETARPRSGFTAKQLMHTQRIQQSILILAIPSSTFQSIILSEQAPLPHAPANRKYYSSFEQDTWPLSSKIRRIQRMPSFGFVPSAAVGDSGIAGRIGAPEMVHDCWGVRCFPTSIWAQNLLRTFKPSSGPSRTNSAQSNGRKQRQNWHHFFESRNCPFCCRCS